MAFQSQVVATLHRPQHQRGQRGRGKLQRFTRSASHVGHLGVPLDRDIGGDGTLGEEATLSPIGQSLAIGRREEAGDARAGHRRSRGRKPRAAVVLCHELLVGRPIVPLQELARKSLRTKAGCPASSSTDITPPRASSRPHQGRFARHRGSAKLTAPAPSCRAGRKRPRFIAGRPRSSPARLALQG